MKFSTRQDIEAPIDFVFGRATDFPAFERQALRRGIEIERVDEHNEVCAGLRWSARFSFRNKPRRVKAELTEYEMPHSLLFQSVSGGVEADMDVEFLPLSRNRTRVRIGLNLSPRTLPARLLVQSLKFARTNLEQRFSKRIELFGRDVEDRFARQKNVGV